LVQYQYGHVPLPVLASQHGARTGTGIFELWFSTGIGSVESCPKSDSHPKSDLNDNKLQVQ
jgi:hypothetical protein